MGRSLSRVWVQVAEIRKGSVVSDPWRPRPDRLQDHEREAIAICLGRGESLTSIAGQLGRSPSTVTREVAVNGGRQHYRAFDAHQRARRCARRPKAAKLEHGPLAEQVTEWLEELWSPKEISGRLTREHPMIPTCTRATRPSLNPSSSRGEESCVESWPAVFAAAAPRASIKVTSRRGAASRTWS